MAGSKLEIGIGADITDFSKKIKEVEYDLKELSKAKVERIKLGLDTGEINAQIKDVKNTLRDLQTTSKDTGAALGTTGVAMNNFGKQTANGGSALTAFSRIAQDAPYGIIGVGNNITNTAEQFGYLVKSTGSAGGAFKALASSLTGVGGVLLAVSLITTAFTVMSQQGLTVGNVIDKLTGTYDEFGSSVKAAREEGIKSAGKEVESLRSLVAVAQNDNIAKKDRLIAVDKLQSQFYAYYGNLSKEQIMYGNLAKATSEATKALIAKSIAEKLGDKAGDIYSQRLNAQQKFNDEKKKLDKFDADIEKKKLSVANKQQGVFGLTNDIIRKQQSERINILNSIEEERQNVIKLENQYQSLIGVIDKVNIISAPLQQEAPKAIKAKKVNPNAGNEFNPFLNDFSSRVVPEIGLTFVDPTEGFKAFNEKVMAGLTTTEQMWYDFSFSFSDILEQGTEQALMNFGASIGEALANGANVFQAAGESLVAALGQTISAVGKELVKMGVLAQAYAAVVKFMKKAFTNPYALAAAGVALIAIGAAVSASAKKVGGGGMTGGGGGGGQASTSGGSNSNFSSSSGGFSSATSSGGTVVFEIAGQKLIGVLSNTLNANKRLGGQLGIG